MCTEKGCSEVSVRENQPGILERKNEHKGKTKSTIFAKKGPQRRYKRKENVPCRGNQKGGKVRHIFGSPN